MLLHADVLMMYYLVSQWLSRLLYRLFDDWRFLRLVFFVPLVILASHGLFRFAFRDGIWNVGCSLLPTFDTDVMRRCHVGSIVLCLA
jgi:ABC-type uncharacterized transport system permease subunit